jgi:hypothetical protein
MPNIPPSEFSPGLVTTMKSVLDTAVSQIEEPFRTPATKAKMAHRIVKTAALGITDAQRLITAAVEEGREPAD